MDLNKNGKLLADLRRGKGMTQRQVAERLGVQPKTVSKWETGHGFPEVSMLSRLADVLGVSERMLLAGHLTENREEAGNMKRTKFYVCPTCHGILQGTGEGQIICCGKPVAPLTPQPTDEAHGVRISAIEDDYYIELDHEMEKDHFIRFVAYVGYDRVLTVRLYPEGNAAIRFPKMHGGKLYVCCSRHGLFVQT